MDLGALGLFGVRLWAGSIIDGQDATRRGAGRRLKAEDFEADGVKFVDVPVSFGEEVLEFFIADVELFGEGFDGRAFIISECGVDVLAEHGPLRLCEARFEVGKELVNESEFGVDEFGHALLSCCGLDLTDVISIA